MRGGAVPVRPADEYASRRDDRALLERRLARREQLAGYARLGVFLAGLVMVLVAVRSSALHPLWLVVPLGAFIALLFVHESIRRSWHRARRAVAFYRAGLDRLADNWKGKGQAGARFQDENHPYAADIDLFGTGSLFELLCTARTRTGEDTLAGWLKAAADPDEVRARQGAVAELRPQVDLREDLALLGGDLPAGGDIGAVVAWGAEPPLLRHTGLRWPALVLGVLTTTALAGWLLVL